MTESEHQAELSRADQRRQQVINAAVECFTRGGFHGTSMSEISKAAGMSVGHIYHYFENKEALIAAIVERNLMRALDIAKDMQGACEKGQLREAMVAQVDQIVNERLCCEHVSLDLELISEASRNPKIAEIIRAADQAIDVRFNEIFEINRKALGLPPDPLCGARGDLICALFEGMSIRFIENPDIKTDQIVELMKQTINFILTPTP